MTFSDRAEAGRLLSEKLERFRAQNPIVIALPRGGVPVAFPVAERLGAPMDVLIVRKIGAPENPEYGIGAITEGDFYWVDAESLRGLGIELAGIEPILRAKAREVRAWVDRFRGGRPLRDIRGATVLLVDDGLATGVTAVVASEYLRQEGARRIVLAVPVGSPRTRQMIFGHFDEIVVLEEPEQFYAVGTWYEDFSQVSDDEVKELLRRAETFSRSRSDEVTIGNAQISLEGTLSLPSNPLGIVIFAHGSGSSRLSPRNRAVAAELNDAGLATLLFDLLSPEEAEDRRNVFDIPLLASRLKLASGWVTQDARTRTLPQGFFGASTGAGAALWAAADLGDRIQAVVSRGGRPDLAIPRLDRVNAPVLLIVGGDDEPVIEMNEDALEHIHDGDLVIVPGATHLFEEPGTLEQVSAHAKKFFLKHLGAEFRRKSSDKSIAA